jgi:hypothetical protein
MEESAKFNLAALKHELRERDTPKLAISALKAAPKLSREDLSELIILVARCPLNQHWLRFFSWLLARVEKDAQILELLPDLADSPCAEELLWRILDGLGNTSLALKLV